MNCFYHPTIVAIGTCKSCSKGICPNCATDLGKGLACKGRCEEEVAAVILLVDRNIRLSPHSEQIVQAARGNRYLGAVFYLVIGGLFLAFAAFQSFSAGFQDHDLLLWGMGSVFVIFGVVTLTRALMYSSPRR
jgi:hypothetical protein